MSAASMPGSGADILGMRPAEFYRLVQKEVERELERRFPQYIDDESLLDIYTEWLVFQIPNLGYHSHKDSSKTIRRGCGYLSSRNYNKGLVLNAFSRHKDRYIRDYPEGSRAFNLARRDVEINYKSLPRPRPTPDPSSTHATSRSSKTAANPARLVPSQTRSTLATPITKSPEEVQSALNDLSPSDRQKPFARFEEPESQGPSFIEPSNEMSVPSSPKTQIPPANYVCNRCGIAGHFIKQCPTNGNPLFDRLPPKGYICHVCGAARTHYVHDCPQYLGGNNSESTPEKCRGTSVSPTVSRNDFGGRLIVPSDEGRVGPCQMYIDPFNTDRLEYSTPLTTRGLGGTTYLGSAGQTEPFSAWQARKPIDDYMNKDRARYIHSQTDNSQDDSQDYPSPIGGSANFGINTKPIGPRRCLDSYRPFSYHPDSYRPVSSSRGNDTYRPDDLYRPSEARRSDISVHRDEPDRQDNLEHQNGRLSPYHGDDSRYYESPDCRDILHRRESPGRWDEPRRRESSARPKVSRQATNSCHPEGPKHRGRVKAREVLEKKAIRKKKTTGYSLHKRKRSDGRLSPWDDIYPPPKKPRQQDDIEGGLPWDNIEAPRRENNQGNSVDSSTAKQIIALDYEPAPNVDSKKAVPSLGYAKAVEELTDAEWEQAGTEANAFLEAFGRELAECPELEASAGLRDECNSDSLTYSSASPVSSTGQPRPPADSAPDDDENVFMADVLDDIAEPTRSMSCEIDEDQPCSHPDIVPFQTLKSLQRDPPYDPDVLNLFRWKNSHVYINVARRRNAVDLYTKTEEERATVKMSNLAV
ncbi:hypothetical protein CSUB01_05465 [Colletotrichum sublineola]|uniref:CCHC-type domain-containing protein n=1 Tax=Colletotrichum sublineola TaxID=1173701 RepID=A0A066XHM3_COLSU|nr:hypothetical protein CSUB01_05465 [Colletotrichum sublineola]